MRRLPLYIIGMMIITLFLNNCASTLPAAGPSSQPMKKADAIYIYTEADPQQAYKSMAQIFQDNGFSIANSDATLQTMRTEPKKLDASFAEALSGPVEVLFNASVRQSDDNQTFIKLNGTYNSNSSNQYLNLEDSEITNHGAKTSVNKQAWRAMHTVAKDFPGGRLEYSRNQ